jgi:GxxExxY protein
MFGPRINWKTINFSPEAVFDFSNKNLNLIAVLRDNLFVEDCIILELKAGQEIIPYFKAKLISQMKIAKEPTGIL